VWRIVDDLGHNDLLKLRVRLQQAVNVVLFLSLMLALRKFPTLKPTEKRPSNNAYNQSGVYEFNFFELFGNRIIARGKR